jgi:hypothetical protein
MHQRQMRQCELAAAAFGVEMDKKGRPVSRKRDRVSNYVNGLQRPKEPQMAAIAAALEVPVGDLEACFKGPAQPPPLITFEQSGAAPDHVTVRINGMMPRDLAHQLFGLIFAASDHGAEKSAG